MESYSRPVFHEEDISVSHLPQLHGEGSPTDFYVAQLDDQGQIMNNQKDKQYVVEMNSEVRFRIMRGALISRDAILLVNKPKVTMPYQSYSMRSSLYDDDLTSTGFERPSEDDISGSSLPQVQYTVTQPRQRSLEKLSHINLSTLIPSRAENLEADLIAHSYLTTDDEIDQKLTYHGSKLENRYLVRVEPHNKDLSVNLEFRVQFPEAGSFFIQIEYFDVDLQERNYTDPLYINVEPILLLREKKIRVKELSILTVLSRQLGAIDDHWDSMYNNIAQLKYNAVHFAPIQKYGYSMSHYSIADQLTVDDYFFKTDDVTDAEIRGVRREKRIEGLKWKMGELKKKYGLLGIMDIVLNHTAGNSEWLLEHPEAAYNIRDCPHLTAAYILDKSVNEFSCDYANKKNMADCPSAPYINNEGDIQAVLRAIQERVIKRIEIHEFFLFDIPTVLSTLRRVLQQELRGQTLIVDFFKQKFNRLKLSGKDTYQVLNEQYIINRGAQRNGVSFKLPHAVAYAYIACNLNEQQTIQKLEEIMKRHNSEWRVTVDGFMKNALKSFEGEMKYHKLEKGNKRITAENPIVERYFRELNNPERSCVAHNGWIMNANPLEDFGMVGWHYLDRSINIWSDSVKLRFGDCPADSPYLWEHMSEYVYAMAMIFDGFRLDNAHSTPIHVANYMLQVARSVNPNLFVMAELFTSSAELDAMFVRRLNINGLIREIQNTYDPKQLGNFFHQITCREAVLGQVDQDFEDVTTGQKYRILKPRRPNEILYDCTHDNPAPIEKFKTAKIALSHMGVIAMSDITIASTWGYDQLLPRNISVIAEKKLYSAPNQDDLFQYDEEDPNTHLYGEESKQKFESFRETATPERTPEEHYMHQQREIPSEYIHEFVFYCASAKRVTIAGLYEQWDVNKGLEMVKESGDKWVLKHHFPIIEGETQKLQFKFVLDGQQWKLNDSLPKENDGKGNINNYLEVPGSQSKLKPIEALPIQTLKSSKYKEWTFNDLRYARKKLNAIHEECTTKNAEIFLHQQDDNVLVIIRQFSFDHDPDYDAYVSITRHCYYQDSGDYKYQTAVELPGLLSDVVFCGYLEVNNQQDFKNVDSDPKYIRSADAKLKTFKSLEKFCRVEQMGLDKHKLIFHMMPPSFTLIVKTKSLPSMKDAAQFFNRLLSIQSFNLARQFFGEATSLSSFNHLLFRCEPEEREISGGQRGPYGLEKYGVMTYSGIASFMTILRELKVSGDLGHELFENLRKGDWYLGYAIDRLNFMNQELEPVIQYLKECRTYVQKLPMSYKPKYVSRVIEKLYNAAVYEITQVRMKDRFINVNSDDLFIQRLALGVIQMWGRVPSAAFQDHQDTMAAGLPHFSTGYTRCWGRDTFISLKGLLLSTGLFNEAQDTIVQFAKVLRHEGLIPNLHDRGNNTRFNARDATWFFMQAVKDFYISIVAISGSNESGELFLKETMIDLHFKDHQNQDPHTERLNRNMYPQRIALIELMHQILQAHASGIKFRELNAGKQIDNDMNDQGFNVDIWLDRETGFLHGGNQHNCGTWMDKMGSSEKTGNKGKPATPRDGAPIELTALLYSSLRFMQDLVDQDQIPMAYIEVKAQTGTSELWTYQQWADRIKLNFERCYWIPLTQDEDSIYVIDRKLVNRRGVYKDVFKSSIPFTDYQLRPNLCIAMAYAADLFSEDHARICIHNVESILMEQNCMGIKTLDPQDKNYNGDYNNNDDSKGWNYHQGPEWLWPVGFFLKAKMKFGGYQFRDELKEDAMKWLIPHQKHIIYNSRWEGLPELTNSHGKNCPDSCATQAWSIASILDAIKEMHFLY